MPARSSIMRRPGDAAQAQAAARPAAARRRRVGVGSSKAERGKRSRAAVVGPCGGSQAGSGAGVVGRARLAAPTSNEPSGGRSVAVTPAADDPGGRGGLVDRQQLVQRLRSSAGRRRRAAPAARWRCASVTAHSRPLAKLSRPRLTPGGRLAVAPGDREVARRRVVHRVREQQRRDLAGGGQRLAASAGRPRRCLRRYANTERSVVDRERAVAQRLLDASQRQPHHLAGAATLVGGQRRRAGQRERRWHVAGVRRGWPRAAPPAKSTPGARTPAACRSKRKLLMSMRRPKISEQLLPPKPKLLLIAWRSSARARLR